MNNFIFKEECYRIIGACMEVHGALGPGFMEAVYQEALEIELNTSGIPFTREAVLDVYYKGKVLNKKYVADFVCYDDVILELKALDVLRSEHMAQVLNYLMASGKRLGLLVNFGSASLEYKRVIL
ncbi:MAG: GxxExxY protein [Marinifilaceae bacterium]